MTKSRYDRVMAANNMNVPTVKSPANDHHRTADTGWVWQPDMQRKTTNVWLQSSYSGSYNATLHGRVHRRTQQ